MEKTNFKKNLAAFFVISSGLLISLFSPTKANTSWNFNSYGNGEIDSYSLSGPGGYQGNGTTSRMGHITIDNYSDNYGSISCTRTRIGSFGININCN